MAGFIEKFLDAIKLSDRYEDDEDFDEYYDDDLSYQTREEERARSRRSRREKDNTDLDDIDLKGNQCGSAHPQQQKRHGSVRNQTGFHGGFQRDRGYLAARPGGGNQSGRDPYRGCPADH